jgi:transcriptional regulator with XRE-family HTH domain
MNNELENKEGFIPSPVQAKFAKLYLETPEHKRSQERIAEELGISRRTIYNWLHKKPEFRKWLNNKRKEIINDSLVDIYKVAVTKAKSGDYNFVKLMLEMAGDYRPGMKIDTGEQELIRIEVVQAQQQAQQGNNSTPEAIESHQKPQNGPGEE